MTTPISDHYARYLDTKGHYEVLLRSLEQHADDEQYVKQVWKKAVSLRKAELKIREEQT